MGLNAPWGASKIFLVCLTIASNIISLPYLSAFFNIFSFPAWVLRWMPRRNIWTPNKAKDRRRPHFTSLKKSLEAIGLPIFEEQSKIASGSERSSAAHVFGGGRLVRARWKRCDNSRTPEMGDPQNWTAHFPEVVSSHYFPKSHFRDNHKRKVLIAKCHWIMTQDPKWGPLENDDNTVSYWVPVIS